jgi:predicted ferric reductase
MANNSSLKILVNYGLFLILLLILLIPGYVFFQNRGGFGFLGWADFKTSARLLFPLVGLYAFTLLWTQLIIGPNAILFRKTLAKISLFHHRQGIFIFLLVIAHPTLILIAYGLTQYLGHKFLPRQLVIYAFLGTLALGLLILTVLTAVFSRLSLLRAKWRVFHYLNYAIFALIWIHSWNLGSDIQSTNLKYLWMFFGVTALASAFLRFRRTGIKIVFLGPRGQK